MKAPVIIVDLGFGDCGKGLAVDHQVAADPDRSLVIRFSGGHQVGHTVCRGGVRHTFSNFGSGTLLGVPTYYLPITTVFPPSMLIEAESLGKISPKVFLDPLVMVTTPWDIALNRARERCKNHGSCGVGFGTTVERHLAGVALHAKDLVSPWVARQKLKAVAAFSADRAMGTEYQDAYLKESAHLDGEAFLRDCAKALDEFVEIATTDELPTSRDRWVMEGSQGIMLDQVHGLFPHVTRANTTSENAFEFLRERGRIAGGPVTVRYVSRCYQNRHGNGPMSDEREIPLVHNEAEANGSNRWQGSFRVGELDPELLNYALETDRIFHSGFDVRRELVITCLDQRPGFDVGALVASLRTRFDAIWESRGPSAATLSLREEPVDRSAPNRTARVPDSLSPARAAG